MMMNLRGRRNASQREQRMATICELFNPGIETATAVDNVFKTQAKIKEVIEVQRVSKLRLMNFSIESRKPFCDERSALIKKIPQFWKKVFLNNPFIVEFFTDVDNKMLDSLSSVEVGKHKHDKPGITISFEFDCNDYIKSKKVDKCYAVLKRSTSIEVSKIQWTSCLDTDNRPRSFFFTWLNEKKDPREVGRDLDEFAEIIIDLWQNAGHYYYNKMKTEGPSSNMQGGSSSSLKDPSIHSTMEVHDEGKQAKEEEMEKIHLRLAEICVDERVGEEAIEQKYFQDLKGLFDSRKEQLKSLPRFWYEAFIAHPTLYDKLNSIDIEIFKVSLTSIEVEHHDSSSCSIAFHFTENDYFSNQCLGKRLTYDKNIVTSTTATTIVWKKEIPDIVEKSEKEKKLKLSREGFKPSFFHWFRSSDDKEELKKFGDQIAVEVGQLWIDPFKHLHKDHCDTEDEAETEVKRRNVTRE